jgi:hypothetical protein
MEYIYEKGHSYGVGCRDNRWTTGTDVADDTSWLVVFLLVMVLGVVLSSWLSNYILMKSLWKKVEDIWKHSIL